MKFISPFANLAHFAVEIYVYINNRISLLKQSVLGRTVWPVSPCVTDLSPDNSFYKAGNP